jgi:TonB-linked SusC/RagA family outer membrane protein
MRKITILLTFLFLAGMQYAFAQAGTISGKVTSSEDGKGIPGVTIQVKGTTVGTTTDINGDYSLDKKPNYEVLIFSYVGMNTVEVTIGDQTTINVVLEPSAQMMEEVVVTALGISREKKSLGYATQNIDGADLSTANRDNFISNLSGRAAGVQIKTNGNIGGSTNVIIRGTTSLTQNNQALFVVDGVPINNDNSNNQGQLTGRHGYDFGNAASDINPNDIASVNILKGAAATALYGSRAANGVILITTKKGAKQVGRTKIYGVSITSNVTTGFVDKSTFPKYQTEYGGGYGPFYGDPPYTGFEHIFDVNGDGTIDYTVPTYEDASMGQKFDPSISVYQWDSYYPSSPNYHKATPWIDAENGPDYFLKNSFSNTNSIEINGGGDATSFRLSYTNQNSSGIMPNSQLNKNSIMFSGSYDIVDNLTVSTSLNYINDKGKGRNATGYSDNIMSSFRQWMQTNVDYKMQKELYDKTEQNITWNPNSPEDLAPAYWDNPYWVRYQNYETDERNRIVGYVQADWKITSYLSLMGRASIDTYSQLQEERKAVGSASGEFGVERPDITSGYSRFNKTWRETNLDMILRFYKNLGENWNLTAFIGTNIRRSMLDQVYASTDGGLIVPGLYSLSNSANPMRNPEEKLEQIGVNGYYGSASVGFKNFLFLEGTYRRDVSSTLPEGDNAYGYPSVTASWLFSNNVNADWLQLGKVRVNYAEVGNDAPALSIYDTYDQFTTFSGTALFSLPNRKNNEHLLPERTKSYEAGLELTMFHRRLGFDFSYYNSRTYNQIMPIAVSFVTGYSTQFVNAGEIENKGFEIQLSGAPVAKENFRWDMMLNFAQNKNQVVALYGDIENLQIGSLQGGVTINARLGEPYGTIQGTDYVYTNGQKTVGSDGYYLKTATSDKVLGDINPDFNLGFNNKFSLGAWSLSFLLDWQQGGSVFSLDQWYGMGTGLYEETVFTNDLGNPVRSPVDEGGGLILDGVYADGSANTTRVEGGDYRVFGWSRNPNAAFVYDATYIKLREAVLSYSIPQKVMQKANWIHGATFSLVGYNLWILYKDLPHADPEASQSSGNVQGWQSGVMPTTRNIGLTVNLQF